MTTLHEALEPFRTVVRGPNTLQEMAVAVQKWAEENNCTVYPRQVNVDPPRSLDDTSATFCVTFECVPKV